MSNLQIIEGLCRVVETQARIISRAAARLQEMEALDAALAEQITTAEQAYIDILGPDEAPDFMTTE